MLSEGDMEMGDGVIPNLTLRGEGANMLVADSRLLLLENGNGTGEGVERERVGELLMLKGTGENPNGMGEIDGDLMSNSGEEDPSLSDSSD
jgi:hypothetical protein